MWNNKTDNTMLEELRASQVRAEKEHVANLMEDATREFRARMLELASRRSTLTNELLGPDFQSKPVREIVITFLY